MEVSNFAADLHEAAQGLEPADAQALLHVARRMRQDTRAEKEAHLRYLLLKKKNQENAKKLQELAGGSCRQDNEVHPPVTEELLGAACDTVDHASSPLVVEPTQPVPSTLVAAPTTTPPVSSSPEPASIASSPPPVPEETPTHTPPASSPLVPKPASPNWLEVLKGFLTLCLFIDYGGLLRDVSLSRAYRSAFLWTLLYFAHCF